MRRLAATSSFSSWRTSGRRSSTSDGRPAGTVGTLNSFASSDSRSTCGANTSRGERPVSTASADSNWLTARCAVAISAATASRSALACARSYCPITPACARSVCSVTVCSRSASVSFSSCNCASAALSPKYVCATAAATPVRTVSRAYSVASRSFCAARVAVRYLPHRSTSYDACSPSRKSLPVAPKPGGSGLVPTSVTRLRLALMPRLRLGYRSADASLTCARAVSMRAIAACRSRLFASASSISAVSAGSLNSVHQCESSRWSTVAAGSSTAGGAVGVVVQPAIDAAIAKMSSALRDPAAPSEGRDSARAGGSEQRERGNTLILISVCRHRRMARRLRHVVRCRARMLDLAQQLIVAAPLDEPSLGDHAIEQRHEKHGEEGRRKHAAHDARAGRMPCARAGAGRQRKRRHAEDEGERRHQRSEEHTSELQSPVHL